MASSQLFDEALVQGVRITFSDGTVATFYGPCQIDMHAMEESGAITREVEIFAPQPLPDGATWEPITVVKEEQP